MSTNQPTEPMDTTPRDLHLPPPAVCDWLLEQKWPGVIPETRIDFQGGSPDGVAGSHLIGYQQARVSIGVDQGGGRIFLPDEALDVLRKDQDDRRAALGQKRQACEADEMARKVNREQQRVCEAEAAKVVWPLPLGHEWPWNRPGWCDDQGRCWLCVYPDDGWHIPTWKLDRPSNYDIAAAIRGEGVLSLPHDALPLTCEAEAVS